MDTETGGGTNKYLDNIDANTKDECAPMTTDCSDYKADNTAANTNRMVAQSVATGADAVAVKSVASTTSKVTSDDNTTDLSFFYFKSSVAL